MRPLAMLIAAACLAVGCKPKSQAVEAQPWLTAAPKESRVDVSPVPNTAPAPAQMSSLYQEEFVGDWPVDAPYINLVCERRPDGERALTVTVNGDTFALNSVGQAAVESAGSLEDLLKVFKRGIDADQAAAMLTERALSTCP